MLQSLIDIPKVELHLHLEGAIPLPALWELIRKYDTKSSISGIDDLAERFQYSDFPSFIDTWVWKNSFLREYDDFRFIAAEVAGDLARQNIKYAEVFYSPGDFVRHGLEPQQLTKAIRRGLDQHSDAITINLVADLVRDFGPDMGMAWLEQINEVRDSGVVGIGIGGSEQKFPPSPYATVYDKAREMGFRTSAHAGEAAGAQSIWSALLDLKAERIGHATRAMEDPQLVTFLLDKRIPLEMCPISNLRTGVVKSLAEHPIGIFHAKCLLVTVSTDDPKMFNNSLVQEYEALIQHHGFRLQDFVNLINNSIEAAWCSEQEKNC